MKIKLGFSPCPNDTFIFYAMINKKIDCQGLEFEPFIADVQELNKAATDNILDITKISYHAYCFVANNYIILDSGSALGKNNGPLLISKRKIYPDEITSLKIAIPGEHTTANLLLKIEYPEANNKINYLFSDIEEAVSSEEVDAGLIIHENRFSYQQKGLRKITDFGEVWETKVQMPLPLGGIVVRRELTTTNQQKINFIIRQSLEYALANPIETLPFVKKYAQNINQDVIFKHINLYVNDFTKNLGKSGRDAILKLYEIATNKNIIEKMPAKIFI